MPVLARKSGWNAARTEPIDSCSITVTLQSLGTVCWATKGSSIQQGSPASATRAGAGAGTRLVLEHISSQGGRPPEDSYSSLWPALCQQGCACSRRPLQAPARALRLPPAYIQVPLAASAVVHAHCPHACGTLASSVYSAIGGSKSSWKPPARHNQESDLSWILKIWVNERCCCNLVLSTRWKYLKVKSTACMVGQNQDSNLSCLLKIWVNEPCCCNLFLSAPSRWKNLKVKSTACMIGHRSWQFGSKEWREYWQ